MPTGSVDDKSHDVNVVNIHTMNRALNRALNIFGDPWSLQIIKEAFLGVRRFQDFQERLNIPRQTLMLRLNRLTDNAIFYKKPKQYRRVVYEYYLTPKGIDLYPFNLMVWRWHKLWHLDEKKLPVVLYHLTCGKVLDPQMVCGGCTKPFDFSAVDVTPGPDIDSDEPIERRRARIVNELSTLDNDNLATVILGDRWSILVLHALLRSILSYNVLKKELNISSNVLSMRLKTLQSLGLLEQQQNEKDLRSYDYLITNKGRDIYPIIMALIQWSDRWLAGSNGPSELYRHQQCGDFLQPRVVCSHCGDTVNHSEVRL